jgi:hypothetical protein
VKTSDLTNINPSDCCVFVQISTNNVSTEIDDNDGKSDGVVMIMTKTRMMIMMIMLMMITIMWRIDPLLSGDSVNSGRCSVTPSHTCTQQ